MASGRIAAAKYEGEEEDQEDQEDEEGQLLTNLGRTTPMGNPMGPLRPNHRLGRGLRTMR